MFTEEELVRTYYRECAACYRPRTHEGGRPGDKYKRVRYVCKVCEKPFENGNTTNGGVVPMVCRDCSVRHNACTKCGEDLK